VCCFRRTDADPLPATNEPQFQILAAVVADRSKVVHSAATPRTRASACKSTSIALCSSPSTPRDADDHYCSSSFDTDSDDVDDDNIDFCRRNKR